METNLFSNPETTTLTTLLCAPRQVATLTPSFRSEGLPQWFIENYWPLDGTGTPTEVGTAQGAFCRLTASLRLHSEALTSTEFLSLLDERQRARDWVIAHSEEHGPAMLRGFLSRMDSLHDMVEILDHDLLEEFDGELFARHVFTARDELESLAWTLEQAYEPNIRERLQLLDGYIQPWLQLIRHLGGNAQNDEWLTAVSRRQPNAWWVF